MSILVIRPQPHGQELCHQLTQHGFSAIHLPLVRFKRGRECPQLISQIEQSQIVIAISQQAARFSHEYLMEQGYR